MTVKGLRGTAAWRRSSCARNTRKAGNDRWFNVISQVSRMVQRWYQVNHFSAELHFFFRMRFFISLLLAAILLNTPSCDRKHEDKKAVSKHKPKPEPKPVAKEKHEPEKHDASKEIEALTGAHTRLVWAECAEPEDSDTYATRDGLVLQGIDTRDGLGERSILS